MVGHNGSTIFLRTRDFHVADSKGLQIPIKPAETGWEVGGVGGALSLSLSFSLSLPFSLLLTLLLSFFLFSSLSFFLSLSLSFFCLSFLLSFSQGKRENLPRPKGKRESRRPKIFTPNSLAIHTARTHAQHETISQLGSPPNLRSKHIEEMCRICACLHPYGPFLRSHPSKS